MGGSFFSPDLEAKSKNPQTDSKDTPAGQKVIRS